VRFAKAQCRFVRKGGPEYAYVSSAVNATIQSSVGWMSALTASEPA
jgi:hypothetical protein